MGYNTNFEGAFDLDQALTAEQKEYLEMFAETRRMLRSLYKLQLLEKAEDGNSRCFELLSLLNLPIGPQGDFYCGTGMCGQDHDHTIIDYNTEPTSQHGLWCQWVPDASGMKIEWSGTEKFYEYTKWLEYIITNFLKPWGHNLNGRVSWFGEERSDFGVLEVINNKVITHQGKRLKDLDVPKPVVQKPKPSAPRARLTDPSTQNANLIKDLKELRSKLESTKKGTVVASRMLATLIAKYDV